LLEIAIAFLFGLAAAHFISLPPAIWFGLGALALVGEIASRRVARALLPTRVPSHAFLLVAAVMLGAARYQSHLPILDQPGFIAAYNNTDTRHALTARIVQPPDLRDYHINLTLEAEQIRPDDDFRHTEVRGRVLARVPHTGDAWQYGDRIVITGYLETPPEAEEFSYREYLARQGVYSYISRGRAALLESKQGNPIMGWIYTLKGNALRTVYQLFPDPEASLLAGILLGVETGIPRALEDDFRDTGTSHIIAISGFNITIIAGIFATTFGRVLGKRRGAFVAILGVALYTLLVGADAAVVRAAIMGTLLILAVQAGRAQDGLRALVITAAVMAYANPLILGDVGFQLSFAATFGILSFAQPLENWFTYHVLSRYFQRSLVEKVAPPLAEFVLVTLAAQFTTLPLIVFHFQRFSLSSFLANPLILPAQPAVMVFGGATVFIGLLAPTFAALIAPFPRVFVTYTIRVVEALANLPGGVIVFGKVHPGWVVGALIAILGITMLAPRIQPIVGRIAGRIRTSLLITGSALVAIVTWVGALNQPDGHLHLTLLDVGAGEALVIQTPTGRHVLINGGSSTVALSNGLGRRLPRDLRELDFLVVGAVGGENIGGVSRTLERFPPAQTLWSGSETASRDARILQEVLVEMGIPIHTAQPGHTLDLGDGASLRVVTVGTRGGVFLLEYGNFRALLPIGADFDALESLKMGADIGPVSVLLLADSGFAPLTPPAWIANLRPQVTLLSVDAGDLRGLPNPETLATLEGYSLLRTDEHGWIHLATDGKQLWVEIERGNE
jgi:competence protein ComEC